MGGVGQCYLMGGATAAFFAGGAGSPSFTGTMTVGSATIGGKGYSSTARGFGTSSSPYGAFGSIAPTAYRGFPIVAIYDADASGTTVFEVSGDATAFSPLLTVGGVNQNLGVGAFSGGFTTFQGTATDPFTGHATVAIAIS